MSTPSLARTSNPLEACGFGGFALPDTKMDLEAEDFLEPRTSI